MKVIIAGGRYFENSLILNTADEIQAGASPAAVILGVAEISSDPDSCKKLYIFL